MRILSWCPLDHWSCTQRTLSFNSLTNKRTCRADIESLLSSRRLHASESSLLYWWQKRKWRCFQIGTWHLDCVWYSWSCLWYDLTPHFQDNFNKDAYIGRGWWNAKLRLQRLSLWYIQISPIWNPVCCGFCHSSLRHPWNDKQIYEWSSENSGKKRRNHLGWY